ncbi:MAG TPA: hypothetical protein V6C58_05485, partial [Allocoleopsis sp.]
MKIAIIDKAPNKNNYSKYFDFPFELFHMSSVPVQKLLKKDVDLELDLDEYDLVILVGSEAAKEYAKVTSVTTHAGILVKNKFVCINNPAMLIFKPEGKQDFDRSVEKIKRIVAGELQTTQPCIVLGIDNEQEANLFLKEVLENADKYVSMDTEGTALYPRDGYVLGVSISYKSGHGAYILTDVLNEENTALLQEIIEKFTIIFHNMKYDIKMLEYHLGLKFYNVHDTMVMHYVLDENGEHGLKALALKYTKYGDYDAALEEFKKDYCKKHGILLEDFTYDLIPFEIISIYAGVDTAATFDLFHKFLPLIEANDKLSYVYYEILIPGTLFLKDMEEVGIPIDKERMTASEKYLESEIQKAKEKIYEYEEVRAFEKA